MSNTFTNANLVSNGITASWANTSITANPVLTIPADGASLEVKGKMILNGVDLDERLKNIEQVLMIPERDVILESKYPKLKKMYDEYIKELSKARMWESLKGENA
jgi:hypothetical protein